MIMKDHPDAVRLYVGSIGTVVYTEPDTMSTVARYFSAAEPLVVYDRVSGFAVVAKVSLGHIGYVKEGDLVESLTDLFDDADLPQEALPSSVVVQQLGSPVGITGYSFETFTPYGGDKSWVRHSISYTSTTSDRPTAVEFFIFHISAFNEYLSHTRAFASVDDEGEKQNSVWEIGPVPPSMETGIIFVNQVRLSSGKIWRADTDGAVDEITEMLRRDFEIDLDDVLEKRGQQK